MLEKLKFSKMHGLGNDFVILDARNTTSIANLTLNERQLIAHRRYGVGCDQLIVIYPPISANTHAFIRFYNQDGGESGACGNGTRCVTALLMQELQQSTLCIETTATIIQAWQISTNQVKVDMGEPRLAWAEIPVNKPCDTLALPLEIDTYTAPVGVNMGNPHAVFFVDNVESVPLAKIGEQLEYSPIFPERANIEFVQILNPETLRMRVWERGVGITQACGTGACATLVAAVRRELSARAATVIMDGGTLWIEWDAVSNHVLMTGEVATAFVGEYLI